MARRLHPGDSQRVIRAWEVIEATGRSLADWQGEPVTPPDIAFRVVVLLPPREELYATCDRRVIDMAGEGALEEVRALAARAVREDIDPALPVFKALGYSQFLAHVAGSLSLAAPLAGSQHPPPNHAKHQHTCFPHPPDRPGHTTDK